MKKEFKPMTWLVANFDVNAQVIKQYDVLKYREDYIKKLKKQCTTKEEFAQKLKSEILYHYWSRAEYELIIEKAEDGRIWLLPWCGCYEPEKVKIDVTDKTDFDWKGFADKHINPKYSNDAKIDIYNQLIYRFDDFVDYCWNYRHKRQRNKTAEVKNEN